MIMNEWVSVKDRLPSSTDDVLVIDDSGRMSVSCYFLSHDMYVWECRDDQIRLGEVTHWMPLPDHPKIT